MVNDGLWKAKRILCKFAIPVALLTTGYVMYPQFEAIHTRNEAVQQAIQKGENPAYLPDLSIMSTPEIEARKKEEKRMENEYWERKAKVEQQMQEREKGYQMAKERFNESVKRNEEGKRQIEEYRERTFESKTIE